LRFKTGSVCRGWQGLLVAAGLFCWAAPAVWAQSPAHKLRRGLLNTLLGWTELVRVPGYLWECATQEYYRRDLNVIVGCPARAMAQPFGRELLGLSETLTFAGSMWPTPFYGSPYERFLAGDQPWGERTIEVFRR
jgi:hypothetical protein